MKISELHQGFPHGPSGKDKVPDNTGYVRDMNLKPGLGRSHGGGHGNPLQYSFLENPMNREAWQTTVHRVSKRWT